MEKILEAARIYQYWLPVMDGGVLARDPFTPDAPGISASIPMMLGNTHDETSIAAAGMLGGKTGEAAWAAAPGVLKESCGVVSWGLLAGGGGAAVSGDLSRDGSGSAGGGGFGRFSGLGWAGAGGGSAGGWRTGIIRGSTGWTGRTRFRGIGRRIRSTWRLCSITARGRRVWWERQRRIWRGLSQLADRMASMLIRFAATGDPNGVGLPRWPAYAVPGRETMIFDERSRVEGDPRGKERVFAAAGAVSAAWDVMWNAFS